MIAHSPIGASSMHRWSVCPGSVRLCKDIPKQSSKYADEGTLAHEFAAHMLTKIATNERELEDKTVFEKNIPDGMEDAVNVYLDVIASDHNEVDYPQKLLIEHRFDLSEIHPGLFGTADAVLWDDKRKLLRVYDYKHGAGISVDVENNSQLLYYGLGALLTTGFNAAQVELVIVQPRCPNADGLVRRWRFDAIDLIDFSTDLAMFAKRTEEENAPLKSGDHCRFCPAAAVCPELQTQALTVAKEEFSSVLSYDPENLARCLNMLPVLEGWVKNVREFAYREAQHGRSPPGFKLVAKRPVRKWAHSDIQIAQDLEEIIDDHESIWERKLKSPAQLEKMMPKEKRKEFGDLWVQVSSGTTLVPETDNRQAVQEGAKSDFDDVFDTETDDKQTD